LAGSVMDSRALVLGGAYESWLRRAAGVGGVGGSVLTILAEVELAPRW